MEAARASNLDAQTVILLTQKSTDNPPKNLVKTPNHLTRTFQTK
jgi:hypothetical protein